uniref:Peptidase s1 and s6 chymotrypsin/hap n=1 Tax=uncultured bacterium SA343_p TaxID=1552128 RepID=A0A0K0LBD9_9BACT|nr:peptidase s1 and s6 chymotrypsin/hap [uncultured bacterium SA343_p]
MGCAKNLCLQQSFAGKINDIEFEQTQASSGNLGGPVVGQRLGQQCLGSPTGRCGGTHQTVYCLDRHIPCYRQSTFRFLGTGFVVGDGTKIVTNAHVAGKADALAKDEPGLVVQVPASNGIWAMHKARVLEKNETHDLALLKIDGTAAPSLKVVVSHGVREGDDLAFTGFPIGGLLGFSPVTHRATVSSITTMALPSPTSQRLSGRAIRSLRDAKIEVFQLDGTAYPGNSGGPLFDPANGEVLGVINMVLIKSTRESALTQPSGITYAIPSRYVLEMLERNP